MDTGQHTFFIGRFGLQILFVVVSIKAGRKVRRQKGG